MPLDALFFDNFLTNLLLLIQVDFNVSKDCGDLSIFDLGTLKKYASEICQSKLH